MRPALPPTDDTWIYKRPDVRLVSAQAQAAELSDSCPALSTAQRRVMTAIETCRTAALGGHVEQCDACGQQRIAYNSCLMESASFGGARVSSRFHMLDVRSIRDAMGSP